MTIELLLFARLREICGTQRLELTLAPGATATSALDELERRFPAAAELRGRLMIAVNEEYADGDCGLEAGDIVALIPPVSGGVGDHPRARVDAERARWLSADV